MRLTIAHILELIDELPKGIPFEYVKPGKNKAMLLNVDKEKCRVEMARVSSETNEQSPCFFTEDNLQTIADSVFENKPFVIDKIFNNGGNTRSVWESILANTSEFYKCMVQKNKNLVWVPTKKGKAGIVEEMTLAEIPISESGETNNTRNIREEFSYFLSSCVKSNRTTNNSLGTFGSSAVGSYLSMLDKREDGTILLFDYNPEKWKHIQNVYEITDPTHAEELYNQLISDNEFVSRNYENNNNWRAGALNLYVLFLRARKYFSKVTTSSLKKTEKITLLQSIAHLPYLTALRTKPFMLLAGISGTGKSRIVREMAKACWKPEDDEYWKDKEKQIRNNHPRNFCMVQVKPNWHDSSELIGYVTRISGTPEFVAGDFIKFVVKAWYDEKHPYFMLLDEMNLAPVEQYFAEYLSVIESRKARRIERDGENITEIYTDPILKASYHRKEDGSKEPDEWYVKMVDSLLVGCPNEKLFAIRQQFLEQGISIPQNLFVVGTVNMDETTFSFSRKVLDRAMTIEMNEVNLHGGLEKDSDNEIGYIGNSIIGDAAEGKDVYEENKELCDEVLAYLEQVNAILEGTPFKIAYRTRNEFLMYAVNRKILAPDSQLWQTLDEMTSMKILSRIEGDSDRTKDVLERLKALVEEEIVAKMNNITGDTSVLPSKTGEAPVHPSDTGETPVFPGEATIFPSKTGETPVLRKSISAKKIEEMLAKLKATGFTSYWA